MSLLWSMETYRVVRCMCVVMRNFARWIVSRYLRMGWQNLLLAWMLIISCRLRCSASPSNSQTKFRTSMVRRIQVYMTFREWTLFLCSRLLIQALPKQSNYRIFSISNDVFSHILNFLTSGCVLHFLASKNQCQNVTLFGQNARHIFIFTTLVTRQEIQK